MSSRYLNLEKQTVFISLLYRFVCVYRISDYRTCFKAFYYNRFYLCMSLFSVAKTDFFVIATR